MFVLRASNGKFYNGRAGDAWLSDAKSEAFTMGAGEAAHKAALFNSRTVLHGLTFEVVAL